MLSWVLRKLVVLYMRTPEHPAKYRIVRWIGRNLIPEAGVQCVVYPDLTLTLHPRDWIEYLLLRGYQYEPLTLDFLARNLSAGDVAILAGVNFGLHVAVAARAVGPAGRVIGVEPQPRAILRAADNLRMNLLLDQVTLVTAALGSSPGMVSMAWSSLENTGASSLLDQGTGFVVPSLRLGQVLEGTQTPCVRLGLLDVQGYESHVLSGIDAAIAPELLIVELDPEFLARAMVTTSQVMAQMSSLGYHCYSLGGREVGADPSDLPERNVVGVRTGCRVSWAPEKVTFAIPS